MTAMLSRNAPKVRGENPPVVIPTNPSMALVTPGEQILTASPIGLPFPPFQSTPLAHQIRRVVPMDFMVRAGAIPNYSPYLNNNAVYDHPAQGDVNPSGTNAPYASSPSQLQVALQSNPIGRPFPHYPSISYFPSAAVPSFAQIPGLGIASLSAPSPSYKAAALTERTSMAASPHPGKHTSPPQSLPSTVTTNMPRNYILPKIPIYLMILPDYKLAINSDDPALIAAIQALPRIPDRLDDWSEFRSYAEMIAAVLTGIHLWVLNRSAYVTQLKKSIYLRCKLHKNCQYLVAVTFMRNDKIKVKHSAGRHTV